MVIGVRMEPRLDGQLDRLAQRQGTFRRACIREAIQPAVLHHGDGEKARPRTAHLARLKPPYWIWPCGDGWSRREPS
jgi:hypothetical protein